MTDPGSVKVCAHPGCPELTSAIYCVTHTRERKQASNRRRGTASQRGYNKRWERTRRAYLGQYPMCECGCGRIATVVHHLDGQGPNGPRGHDPTNLQALAKVCHDRVTAQQQPGGWHKGAVNG